MDATSYKSLNSDPSIQNLLRTLRVVNVKDIPPGHSPHKNMTFEVTPEMKQARSNRKIEQDDNDVQ